MTDDNQKPGDINDQETSSPLSAEKVEVNTELSKVASNPKRNILIMVIFGLVFAYIVYQIIASQQPNTPPPPPALKTPTNVFKPETTDEKNTSAIPAVPELPKIVRPTAPAIEDVPVKTTAAPAPVAQASTPALPEAPLAPPPSSSSIKSAIIGTSPDNALTEDSKRQEAKRKSSVFLITGTPSALTPEEEQIKKDFTYRGDLTYVLGRGKIIDAVLESAINSDFPGEVLALVSRDVYSEGGKLILIPKGSRVIGSFSTSATGGYGRVNIAWSRIDLPSGYSLTLSSDAIDNLGRKGIQGRVDNKYSEQFTNAVLSSAFKIALAAGLDKIVPPPVTTSTAAENTATSTNINSAISSTIASSTYTSATPAAQITMLCAAVQGVITDKTSSIYNSTISACSTAQTGTNANTAAAVSTLQTSLLSVASGLGTVAATTSTPTQAQQATQDAYKDVGSTVDDMLIKNNTFTPTITLNQGEHIKIYVNKDYLFPKKALSNSKVIQ